MTMYWLLFNLLIKAAMCFTDVDHVVDSDWHTWFWISTSSGHAITHMHSHQGYYLMYESQFAFFSLNSSMHKRKILLYIMLFCFLWIFIFSPKMCLDMNGFMNHYSIKSKNADDPVNILFGYCMSQMLWYCA